MKKTVFLKIIILSLLLFFFTQNGYTFSDSLINFINNDKQVLIRVDQNQSEISFLTGKNVVVLEQNGNKKLRLKSDNKYTIKYNRTGNEDWYIQIFATSSKDKAEQIINQINNQFPSYTANIYKEKKLYKVQLGSFLNEKKAKEVTKSLKQAGWETWILSDLSYSGDYQLVIEDKNGRVVYENEHIYLEGVIRYKNNIYNGIFKLNKNNNGLDLLNQIDFLTLEYGLLLTKLPNISNIVSLKAQAILNRSNALYQILNESPPYTFNEYQGISNLTDLIKVSVNSTQAKVIMKDKSIVSTNFAITGINERYSSEENIIYEKLKEIEIIDLETRLDQKQLIDAKIDIGLKYKEIIQTTWSGKRVINIIDLDLLKSRYLVTPFLSNDKIEGLAPLPEVIKSNTALAGINGGFFSSDGKPLGVLMINGIMVTEPLYNRTALGITKTGEILIDALQWKGILTTKNNNNIILDAVNRKPNHKNEIIVYNSYFNDKTPLSNQYTVEYVIKNNIISKVDKGKNIQNQIPSDGYIVKIFNKENIVKEFKTGNEVIYRDIFKPDWHQQKVISIIGGGPCLVKDGEVYVSGTLEQFKNDIIEGKAPRTAVGITEQKHLLFITVDGRQPKLSVGITLKNLADYLVQLGVRDALNLDGGDSSQMVIRGYTFNNPSGYRDIATGLLIKKK
ncbi:MAG: phosphodiester glycosidase family protein [Halanaerobiales bacterium]|nr:phosphodiester glycosidase family protein [Halanaerobiales bacterium]